MKLHHLLARARLFPLFGVADCQKWFPASSRGVLLVQLAEYARQGYLLRLRRGLYLVNNEPRPHPFAVASRLRPEAVISLETVLSESGLMPETSFATVAVTGGRNARYSFPELGAFIFRHLEPRLLFGWRLERFPPYTARVASPEKALLDLLWLHQREKDAAAYVQGLRLSFPAPFSWSRFRSLARQYHQPRLWELARQVASAGRR